MLKAVGKVPFSGSMVTKMAQLGVMWLSCDPLSDSLFVISCGPSFNAAHVIKLTLRFCIKNIFKSTLTYKRSYKNSTSVHGEVNKLLSNDSRSTIQSVQSCQQKVKNTMASFLNRTEMVTLRVMFRSIVQRVEIALAATLLPSGRVRSVMARTTLGLARAGSFTSSDT